jgi:hypothetical protein
VSLEGYREEFDPDYEEAEEEYDYFARPQDVRDAVGRVQNTGAIGWAPPVADQGFTHPAG